MGNRRAWDYLASKWWLGWMNFTRKDNGLNQYRMWSPYSIINYDDDIGGTWGSPGHANGYSLFANRFLFTGREWSELGGRDIDGCAGMGNLRSERARASQWLSELKLYDYRARLYNPELGRFMQPDPKQFAAGDYNLYRYCHNDPVNKVDPSGLVDLSYTPNTPAFAEFRQWEATYNPRDVFTIAGHADPGGIRNASGGYVSMQRIVADIVKNNPANKPIVLIACQTGRGDHPFAERLAKAVAAATGRTATVTAPTTEVTGGKPGEGPHIHPEIRPGAEHLPLTSKERYDFSKPGKEIRFKQKGNGE